MFGAEGMGGWFSGSSGSGNKGPDAHANAHGGVEQPYGKSTGTGPGTGQMNTEESSKVKKEEREVEAEVENVLHRFNAIKETLSMINNFSVRELKEKIEFYSRGKSKSPDVALFLEKEEMRKNLIEIIFDCVGHSEMGELNSYIYEVKGLSVEPFDRQNLIKVILKQNNN